MNMKIFVVLIFFLASSQSVYSLSTAPLESEASPTNQDNAVLTNDAILQMNQNGLSDDIIVAVIRSSDTEFDASVDSLIALQAAGLSELVILEMVSEIERESPLFGETDVLTSVAQPILPRVFGATVYIEEMEGDLDSFIRAEFQKEDIPLTTVMQIDAADFVLTGGGSVETQGSWHEGWLTLDKDNHIGTAMLVRKVSGEVMWAGEAGDRSLLFGGLRRGGIRKVADRLVDDLKDYLEDLE
jgi:hypothetical protein